MTINRRLLWIVATVAVLGVLGLAGLVWLRGPQVDVIELHRAPLVRTLQFSARVATLSRVDVGSTVTGRVAEVRVAEGDKVARGDPLIVLEAMKMEHTLRASGAGRVTDIAVHPGQRVREGEHLLSIETGATG